MQGAEGPFRGSVSSIPQRDEPFSHGILDKDEASRRALKAYLKPVVGATVMIWLVIWSVLGLYWGAYLLFFITDLCWRLTRFLGANWRVFSGLHNLDGWIVDFDGGQIGSTVVSAYMNATGAKEQINWRVIPSSQFPNGEADVAHAVLAEKCWIAVSSEFTFRFTCRRRSRKSTDNYYVVSAGASDRLNAAIASADNTYNNSAAVTLWGNEARNENA